MYKVPKMTDTLKILQQMQDIVQDTVLGYCALTGAKCSRLATKTPEQRQ